MDITHLLVFAAAYLAVVLLPGPGVTALVARVLTRGTHGAPAYIAGFVTGSLLWFTVAAAGLAALASAFGALFTVIRYAGAIYLVYLAWKFWTAPARPFNAADTSPEGRWPLFLAGAAINLGNPKAVVFFLALLPTILDLDTLTAVGFAELQQSWQSLCRPYSAPTRLRRSERGACFPRRGPFGCSIGEAQWPWPVPPPPSQHAERVMAALPAARPERYRDAVTRAWRNR